MCLLSFLEEWNQGSNCWKAEIHNCQTRGDRVQHPQVNFADRRHIGWTDMIFGRLVDRKLVFVLRQYAESRRNEWLLDPSSNNNLELHDHVDIDGRGIFKGWKPFQLYANGYANTILCRLRRTLANLSDTSVLHKICERGLILLKSFCPRNKHRNIGLKYFGWTPTQSSQESMVRSVCPLL